MTRGANFIKTANWRVVGRFVQELWILPGLIRDLIQRVQKSVDGGFILSLRGLNHERLVDNEGEINRGRVETVVDEALSDIQCANALGARDLPLRYGFVFAIAMPIGYRIIAHL